MAFDFSKKYGTTGNICYGAGGNNNIDNDLITLYRSWVLYPGDSDVLISTSQEIIVHGDVTEKWFYFEGVSIDLVFNYMVYFFVCSSADAAKFDNSKENEMSCNVQESILQAISSTTKIISRESTVEEQADKYKTFFDEATPHYPKRGPVVRYSLSHHGKIGIDFLKENNSSIWNSAYIPFRSISEHDKYYSLDFIKRAQLTYMGTYEKEGAYPTDDEKVVYKFKVSRYSYKNSVIVDFNVANGRMSGEVYPINFTRIHVYVNK